MAVKGGAIFYVRTDHIGRPVFATNDLGVKVWEASYLPFGGVHVATGGIDLRFPGQWFQAESGLHQNWMRDYDPTTGRYIQADPLGLVDGASVYGYALQNPGRFVDRKGTDVWVYYYGEGTRAGHLSMATHGGLPQGKYPQGQDDSMSCCLDRPGELFYDDPAAAEKALRIPLGVSDTMRVQMCIQQQMLSPSSYRLLSSSCVDFVRVCLSEGGIDVDDKWIPKNFFKELERKYENQSVKLK